MDPTAEEGLISAPVSSPTVRRPYANVKVGTVGEIIVMDGRGRKTQKPSVNNGVQSTSQHAGCCHGCKELARFTKRARGGSRRRCDETDR